MMAFTVDQVEYLKGIARHCRIRLFAAMSDKDEYQIEIIADGLREACSMGRAIALDEVSSTPWEMLKVSLYRDTGRGTHESAMDVVDARLAEGWEPWRVCGPDGRYLLMKRRKAVADIAAQEKSQ